MVVDPGAQMGTLHAITFVVDLRGELGVDGRCHFARGVQEVPIDPRRRVAQLDIGTLA